MKSALTMAALVVSFLIAPIHSSAAQDATNKAPPATLASNASDDAAELAKKLQNPIAALISAPIQNNFDFGAGPDGDGFQYKVNIQPVIPITLNEDWNIISRTILPVIYQENITPVARPEKIPPVVPQTKPPPGVPQPKIEPVIPRAEIFEDSSQDGLGDTLQSFFFSPQKPTGGGWVWGVGPVFLLPTATEELLGADKWGAGPTAVALKQAKGWTCGMLANHIWSFAGEEGRKNVNATFMQPFVSYTTKHQTTFTVNSESTYDWEDGQWTVPMNVMAAQLLKVGTMPIQLQVGARYYAEKPANGPEWGLRFSVTFLFPK